MDIAALTEVIMKVSWLVTGHRIAELDINPLLVSPAGEILKTIGRLV